MSKIGPHIPQLLAEGRDWSACAPIVKAIDTIEPFQVAREDAIRVFRHYWSEQPFIPDMETYMARLLAALQGYNHPNLYVEVGWNEASMLPMSFKAIVDRMHSLGYKVCGYQHSNAEGNNDIWGFQHHRINHWFGLDAISLHAYWDKGGPNNPAWEWHALAYRMCGWQPGDPPIIITECNMETIDGTTTDDLRRLVRSDLNISYIQAFDAEIQKDNYVLGAVIYTVNAWPPTPGSHDATPYDVAPIIPRLIALTEVKEEQPMPEPTDKENWLIEYRQNHGGKLPDEWEYHKHQLGILRVATTKEDLLIVISDAQGAVQQALNMCNAVDDSTVTWARLSEAQHRLELAKQALVPNF